MTALAAAARRAWTAWGDYAQFTVCSRCSEHRYCRRSSRSDWLCLDCFDQQQPS